MKFAISYDILLTIFLSRSVVSSAEVCQPVDQCSCKLSNGKYISLWEVDKAGGYKATDELSRGFTYLYSPCSILQIKGTECQSALACQTAGTAHFALAYKPRMVTTGYDKVMKQFIFTYTGSSTKLTFNRVTTMNLVCDPNNKVPSVSSVLESPSGTYSFRFTTKCACPGKCKLPSKPSSSSSSSGLSTGSILCIILLVLVLVYVIGGILINKFVRHQESANVVPNKDFWKDVPFLVKDGCVFTFRRVTGKKADYTSIP